MVVLVPANKRERLDRERQGRRARARDRAPARPAAREDPSIGLRGGRPLRPESFSQPAENERSTLFRKRDPLAHLCTSAVVGRVPMLRRQ
jgi:hypothetical protein